MTDQDTSYPQVYKFITRLNELNPGDRARLKRNAGKALAESQDTLGLFFSLLPPGIAQFQEETFFMIATLFPLADGNGQGNLGGSLARARQSQNNKGLDRRVEVLLDSDTMQLAFRLRQAIHFLQSNRVAVNWPQLLIDLLNWNHPERFVQQRWARSYFSQAQ